jgi:hypothetical protein
MISTETTQQLFEEAAVAHWNVCSCVICGARAGYVFEAGQPPVWNGGHGARSPSRRVPAAGSTSPTASTPCPRTCWTGSSWPSKEWRRRTP